jgi:hypothetical protein
LYSGLIGTRWRLDAGAIATDSGGSAAFVDPYVTIDPATPDASLYSLVFSPGIVNAPAQGGGGGVPESVSWAMLLVGLGAVGAMMRKHRTSTRYSRTDCPV